MQTLIRQAEALLSVSHDPVANAANLSALIWQEMENINWVGFYFLRGDRLVLGPFQGRPACVEIPLDQGVCGAAARARRSLRVEDVHAFAGHIACDSASESELVVPLIDHAGRLVGVLDVDAPVKGRFSEADQRLFEQLAGVWLRSVERQPGFGSSMEAG